MQRIFPKVTAVSPLTQSREIIIPNIVWKQNLWDQACNLKNFRELEMKEIVCRNNENQEVIHYLNIKF